jgi:hypothetical protein
VAELIKIFISLLLAISAFAESFNSFKQDYLSKLEEWRMFGEIICRILGSLLKTLLKITKM